MVGGQKNRNVTLRAKIEKGFQVMLENFFKE
jgi:hypothetical protein